MVIFNRVTSVGRLCLAARWILIINHQQPAPDRCALLPPGDKFLADPGGLSLTPPNAPLLKLCVTLRGAGLWQHPRPLPGSSRSRQLSSSHPGSLSSLLGGGGPGRVALVEPHIPEPIPGDPGGPSAFWGGSAFAVTKEPFGGSKWIFHRWRLLTWEQASGRLFLPAPGTVNSFTVSNKCQLRYSICLSPRGRRFLFPLLFSINCFN